MGAKMMLTGLVIFLTFFVLGGLAKSEPRQPKMLYFSALMVVIGFALIPIGALVLIWG